MQAHCEAESLRDSVFQDNYIFERTHYRNAGISPMLGLRVTADWHAL